MEIRWIQPNRCIFFLFFMKEDHGQFNWDAEIVGLILGAVFYGYMFAQLPACLFIEKFGPKHVFGCGIVFSAVLTFLTPLAASYDFKALIALRALEGLFMVSFCKSNLWLLYRQ